MKIWSVAELQAARVCRRLLEGSTGGEGGTKYCQVCSTRRLHKF